MDHNPLHVKDYENPVTSTFTAILLIYVKYETMVPCFIW